LKNAHVEEFDQFAVNAILKRHGWRVRSKATFSERTVKTRLEEACWQARALFSLDTVADGVVDEVSDEGETRDPHEPLALPEQIGR
jgi:hypothetical protein